MNSPAAVLTEHRIFWLLVKKGQRRDDVGRVYLAVQAALAYQRETVDLAWLMAVMMADGQSPSSASQGIGAPGLAYFHWLFEVELLAAGDEDLHDYRFHRRHDGARVVASLKTAPAPRGLQYQQRYQRELRRLETVRADLLTNGRW